LKAAETSLPPTDTAGADAAPAIRTSASPPLTSSGRDDNTSMLSVCASALDAASASNPPATATDAVKVALFTSRPPFFRLIRWLKDKSQPVGRAMAEGTSWYLAVVMEIRCIFFCIAKASPPFVPAESGDPGAMAHSRTSSTRYALDRRQVWVPASARFR